jgi:hypothetical protein
MLIGLPIHHQFVATLYGISSLNSLPSLIVLFRKATAKKIVVNVWKQSKLNKEYVLEKTKITVLEFRFDCRCCTSEIGF